MRHLIRQWRLLRYIKGRIIEEFVEGPATFGEQDWIPAQPIVTNYAAKLNIPEQQSRDNLNSLIDDGYVSLQAHTSSEGVDPWITVSTSEGLAFLPWFSGLVLSELKLLGPLWTFVGGAAAAFAIIAAVKL